MSKTNPLQIPEEANSECSGFVAGKDWLYSKCKHGFPQTGGCRSGECKTAYGTPVCMSESLCVRLYPETGKPEPRSLHF